MKGLDSTQVEQLKEIAEYLYQQRQHQEISLEKIAKQTYIPQRILQAIESAQLDILPEPVYIKGFIRRYADALGLDGMMIADAFDVEPASLAHTAPEMQPELAVAPPRPAPPELQPEHRAERQSDRNPRPERSPQSNLSFLPWLGAGIAALALGAFAFSLSNQPKQSAVTNPAETSLPTTQLPGSPSPQKSSSPNASISDVPAVKDATLTAGSPVQVDLNLTDRSWLEVSVDGKVAYEGSLDKGEQRTWKAKTSILIVAGNAGAVVASFNQGEAKALGKPGSVVTVAFPTPEKPPSP